MLKKCFSEKFISFIFILILLKVYFVLTNFDIYFEYAAYGLIVLFFILNNKDILMKKISKYIIRIYILFLMLQIIGLLQVFTFFSLKNIITAFIVFIFLISLFNHKFKGYVTTNS